LSASRKDSLRITITIDSVSGPAVLPARIVAETVIERQESDYCDSRLRMDSPGTEGAHGEPGRLSQLVVRFGLCLTCLLLVLMIAALFMSVVAYPLSIFAVSTVLALNVSTFVRMLGQVASQAPPTKP
jgi:hypothetical protein